MAVGLVIVSHSMRLAEGVVELAAQMAGAEVRLAAAGGTDEGELGTSLAKVAAAIDKVDTGEGAVVLVDLGSAALVAEMAREQLPMDRQARVRLSNGPLVEGAVLAAVEASIGSNLDRVAAVAEEAAALRKVQ